MSTTRAAHPSAVIEIDGGIEIVAMSTSTAAEHRRRGGRRYIADASPGYPCRHCLRDAEIGDELILVAHDPFADQPDTTGSPYRATSPVFVHAHECDAPDLGSLPEQLTGRRLSLRCFDTEGYMLGAELIDGTELGPALGQLLDRPMAASVQIHNAGAGCWAATAHRARVV